MTNIKFLHGKNLSAEQPLSAGTFYLDTATNELWYDDPSGEKTNHIRLFDNIFTNIQQQIDDLNYKQINISTFACTNLNTSLEKGTSFSGNLTFNWVTNKIPALRVLYRNGVEIGREEADTTAGGTILVENDTISSTTTYKLEAGDNRTIDDTKYPDLNNASKSVTFNFYHPVLYGAIDKNATIDSALLNNANITRVPKANRNGSYTIDTKETADNLVTLFAIPESYDNGTVIKIGGFQVDLPKTTISYTSNTATPQTVNYVVYTGTNIGMGSQTLVVT